MGDARFRAAPASPSLRAQSTGTLRRRPGRCQPQKTQRAILFVGTEARAPDRTEFHTGRKGDRLSSPIAEEQQQQRHDPPHPGPEARVGRGSVPPANPLADLRRRTPPQGLRLVAERERWHRERGPRRRRLRVPEPADADGTTPVPRRCLGGRGPGRMERLWQSPSLDGSGCGGDEQPEQQQQQQHGNPQWERCLQETRHSRGRRRAARAIGTTTTVAMKP
mmetsp:Transcript_88694/g.180830  ORF Transcript_88694/g.180830 Transcript_88694/m.180830 type:complete len:221 (-) Transcript_88694:299-961(-)